MRQEDCTDLNRRDYCNAIYVRAGVPHGAMYKTVTNESLLIWSPDSNNFTIRIVTPLQIPDLVLRPYVR